MLAPFVIPTDLASHVLDSTLSRSPLPAVKRGTLFAGTGTVSPVFGLRPVRGCPRQPVGQREAAETPNFYPLVARQCVAQSLKNRFDGKLGIFGGELREVCGEPSDEFGTGRADILLGPYCAASHDLRVFYEHNVRAV